MITEIKSTTVLSQSGREARVFIDNSKLMFQTPVGTFKISKIGHAENDTCCIYFADTRVHVKLGAAVALALFNCVKKDRVLCRFDDDDWADVYEDARFGDTFEIVISSDNRIKCAYKYTSAKS